MPEYRDDEIVAIIRRHVGRSRADETQTAVFLNDMMDAIADRLEELSGQEMRWTKERPEMPISCDIRFYWVWHPGSPNLSVVEVDNYYGEMRFWQTGDEQQYQPDGRERWCLVSPPAKPTFG